MSENVTELPITRVPNPTGDPFLDATETTIIQKISEAVDYGKSDSLHHACGLAQARDYYLIAIDRGEETARLPWALYIARATTSVRRLSDRQRGKLRHPARNRQEVQRILDGDSI